MYFKKYLIVKSEIINDINIDNKFNFIRYASFNKNKFFIPKNETAPKIGIDNKKEIFAESILLKFNNLAAVIAIPDLLTPGTKDKIWNKPIKIADLYVKFLSKSLLSLNRSLT